MNTSMTVHAGTAAWGYSGKKSSVKNVQNQFDAEVSKAAGKSNKSNTASVTDDYKRKHPDSAYHVDTQIRAGEALRARMAPNVSTEDMTMEEYKNYISWLMGSVPFDASRPYDEETVFISDAGWEQMKNDPKYEAWVLGYTVENRSVRDPFFGFGSVGCYCVEHFGASIEEHHGEGFSKAYGGTASGARGLFQSKSKRSSMSKKGPLADKVPSKDYDRKKLEEERWLKKKRQEEQLEKDWLKKKRAAAYLNQQYVENIYQSGTVADSYFPELVGASGSELAAASVFTL